MVVFKPIYPMNYLCVSMVITLILYLLLLGFLKDLFLDLYYLCYRLMTYLLPQNYFSFTYLLMILTYTALVRTLTILN